MMKCAICNLRNDFERVQRLEFLLNDLRKRAPDLGIKAPGPGDHAHPSCAIDLQRRVNQKETKRGKTPTR